MKRLAVFSFALAALMISVIASTPGTGDPVDQTTVVRYEKTGAAVLGEVMGDAVDPLRDEPVEGLTVELYDLGGSPVDTTLTDADGKFDFANLSLSDYHLVIDDCRYRKVDLYFEIATNTLKQLPPALVVPAPIIMNGDAGGSVIDVLTGDHLNGVDLDFRKGIDPPVTDPIVYSTTTSGSLGNYYYEVLDLEAGVYTAFASKAGYRDDTFHIYILGGLTVQPQNGALSPTIQGEDMRIVLTWGLIPADLDSHLWAPDPFGAGKVHLYWDVLGSHPWGAFFDLDLDDRESYGPETTTIHQWENQTYCFFVHDYTFQAIPISKFLSYSRAKVVVITATTTDTFYVTPNTVGTQWFVFTVDGATKTVTPQNTYGWRIWPETVGVECGALKASSCLGVGR
jgi:hypothetical protein